MKGSNKAALLLLSMRPGQWIKNGFVFGGLIFSGSFTEGTRVIRSLCAFFIFCMAAGCIYIVNDIMDRKRDRLHPLKRKRPIASGQLGAFEGMLYSVPILLSALFAAYLLDWKLLLVLACYYYLTLAYSLWLKNLLIADVISIALGFVLRTAGGAVAIGVPVSGWLVWCTTLLALFLALNKRRGELLLLPGDLAKGHRKNLGGYTVKMVDRLLTVIILAVLVSYVLYSLSGESPYAMVFTTPFVVYGIVRYQYLAVRSCAGGSPETLILSDRPLMANLVLWGALCMFIVKLS